MIKSLQSTGSSSPLQAFQTKGISDAIVSFSRFLRQHGFNSGVQETQDALQVARIGCLTSRDQLRWALRAVFCQSPEDVSLFEGLFILFWDTNPMDMREERNKTRVSGTPPKNNAASLVMLGRGHAEASKEEAKSVTGSNSAERLKRTDFSKLSEIEASELERIAQKLFREMASRLRRRMRRSRKAGYDDLRRTLRRSVATGGEPVKLFFRDKTKRRQRLIVFLDVSGSMDKYSLFLLRFIWALRTHFRQMEAFIFSTTLVRITRLLRPSNLEQVMETMSAQAENWSSGTRIGECFAYFAERYGKRMLNGQPVVLVLSDGLDTGDPLVLGNILRKMSGRARRIIWLNPLKGMKDYQPLARGMQAALPSIDDFRSAHNLMSLLDLENVLAHE